MQRGYDVLFSNPLLGGLIVFASLLLLTALCAWGSMSFKRLVAVDRASKAEYRKKNSHKN
jgi:hypothetical protein